MALAPDDRILRFPAGFRWGTATSSYQVEGGNTQCDWYAWEQTPGHIRDGSRCGRASDWWERAESDLALAAEWGQNTHRLSLEWSRLEPREGAWDEAAVTRYRAILSFMRARGLAPMVTLHHFTLPLWLAQQGGWRNPRTVDWFARFADRAADALGDLCDLWCTINEPMAQIIMGHVFRLWPPGAGGLRAMAAELRHLSRAHALAYERLHARRPAAQVGYAKHIRVFDPADPRHRLERWIALWADRAFNELGLRAFAVGEPSSLLTLGGPAPEPTCLDFIGLNYYAR
ncbi:MAG: glycoside hydrolase family 1 protein, partial [Chloroflexi bacterium]|nr:glycoside hydrolase family 1 protein [Chloroflexota bacterium]